MLWARDGRGTGTGRATVMIGAGFSKNAVPQTGNAREFPTWRDLANGLIDQLEPGCDGCTCLLITNENNLVCPFTQERRARRRRLAETATGTSGMMELGQKFESMKGPAVLHGALRRAIPDLEYGPGKAHQDLVRLPWADILTTNWDTLLEQAVDAYDRSYELVVQPKQLAVASAPRIVKLHGCIRSGTKLIFTEEDFRTYPSEYAPFVSLVQQSLMENVFVLIGFSGTDPNFKAWHGWVRDNLGQYLQPIYLVTNKAPDPVDVNLFASRFVTIVDLSQLNVGDGYNTMLDEFFRRLRECRREFRENFDWPQPQRGSSESTNASRLDDWVRKLELRPKWLVLPTSNREVLARSLDDAIETAHKKYTPSAEGEKVPFMDAALAALYESPAGRDFNKPFELSDREVAAIVVAEAIELSLARPTQRLLEQLRQIFAEAVLDLVAPGQYRWSDNLYAQAVGFLAKSDVSQSHKDIKNGPASQQTQINRIGMKLLPLLMILEREARWAGDRGAARALTRLADVFELSGDGADFGWWAKLQDSLDQLDSGTAVAVLNSWSPRANESISMLRHAAGLRELGRIAECEVETRQALEIVRRLATSPEQHLADASREAWTFAIYADLLIRNPAVLGPIVDARRRGVTLDGVIEELADRLDELEVRRCDPRRELNRFARDLEHEEMRLALQASSKRIPESDTDFKWIVFNRASSFLVLAETIGLSLWTIERGSALGLIVARLLARESPDLSLTLLLRAGRPSDVPLDGATFRAFFLEPNANRLEKNVDRVISTIHRLVSGYADEAGGERDMGEINYIASKISYLLYLLRGTVTSSKRLAPALFHRIYSAACVAHDSAIMEIADTGWAELRALFQIIINSITDQQHDTWRHHDAFEFIERLLQIDEPRPVPGGRLNSRSSEDWPDPFEMLAWRSGDKAIVALGRPLFVLRPTAQMLIERAAVALSSLSDAARRITNLRQLRKHLDASIGTTGRGRDAILSRRLVVVEALLDRQLRDREIRQRKPRRKRQLRSSQMR
jgi:SIR2-like domain